MKRLWAPLAAIAIAAGLWFTFKSQHPVTPITATGDQAALPTPENSATLAGTNVTPAASTIPAIPTPPVATTPATTPGAAPASTATAVSALPPLTVLDNTRVVMHNYAAVFGENPVGDNSEITAALRGKNPKQVNFISEESGLRVNDQGEMIDAWGTPFFFHQLSGKVMEIRSAGEDKKMWTFDDQVTR